MKIGQEIPLEYCDKSHSSWGFLQYLFFCEITRDSIRYWYILEHWGLTSLGGEAPFRVMFR